MDILLTSQEVVETLGITYRRLDYLVRHGFVTPHRDPAPGSGFSRGWSIENLVTVIKLLQRIEQCPFGHGRKKELATAPDV